MHPLQNKLHMRGSEEEDVFESKPIGKPELLQWAKMMSGGRRCDRMDCLKVSLSSPAQISPRGCHQDGVVILKIIHRIWGNGGASAKMVDLKKLGVKLNARTHAISEVKANWHAIEVIMERLGISSKDMGLDAAGESSAHDLHATDFYRRMKGVQDGKFKACWGFLVMLYFLHSLSECVEFSVDFAHPIEEKLASFLQSDESIAVVELGGERVACRELLHIQRLFSTDCCSCVPSALLCNPVIFLVHLCHSS